LYAELCLGEGPESVTAHRSSDVRSTLEPQLSRHPPVVETADELRILRTASPWDIAVRFRGVRRRPTQARVFSGRTAPKVGFARNRACYGRHPSVGGRVL